MVLAAGESRRMPICKQLLKIHGKTMIEDKVEVREGHPNPTHGLVEMCLAPALRMTIFRLPILIEGVESAWTRVAALLE